MKTLTFVMLIAGTLCVRAQSSTFLYVNQNAPQVSLSTGGSWTNAFRDLQVAIAAAHPTSNNPVEIRVASGMYYPTTGTNRAASFVLKSYLRIVGGFAGTETNDDQRLYYGYPTVLSGDIGTPQANKLDTSNVEGADVAFNPNDPGALDNCYNVVTASNVVGAVLDQLYITGGFATVSTNIIDTVTLQSMGIPAGPTNSATPQPASTVSPLDSRGAGGGLFCINSAGTVFPNLASDWSVYLESCFFIDNGARGYGGAVAAEWAGVICADSVFNNNYAGGEGGAYWTMNCRSDIGGTSFENNTSDGLGGAVVFQSIPTDASVDPQNQYTETIRNAYRGHLAGIHATVKLASKLYKIVTADSEFEGLAGITEKLQNAGFGNPFSSIEGDAASDIAKGVASRFGAAYNWIGLAMTVVDIGMDIAGDLGGNPKVIAGWTWFQNNFNEYATPVGWAELIGNATGLTQKVKALFPAETPDDLAYEFLQQEIPLYNQSGFSTVVQCDFQNNVAGEEGGAVYTIYDNVQMEDCEFNYNYSADAGAMGNFSWNTPKIISCSFLQNIAQDGQSAMVNGFHTRPYIVNCTFSDNISQTAGYAVGNVMGAQVNICNSLFWGNSNYISSNWLAGADIFTGVHTNLDAASLSNYNDALTNGSCNDWVAQCDVTFSCVQSLKTLPAGRENFAIQEAFSVTAANGPEDQQIANDVAQWNALVYQNDLAGTLDTYNFINTGEGFFTNLLDPAKGNIDLNPLLLNGIVPSRLSPVLNHGNASRLDNGVINSLTDLDVYQNPRFANSNTDIDMGAIEYVGGADPNPLAQFPLFPQEIIYVSPGAVGTGTSWRDATGDLASAMTNENFEVWVSEGTYYPTTNGDSRVSFALATNVQVFGGFAGFETDISQRDWVANPTILSGNLGPGINSFTILANNNIDDSSQIDGFIFTGAAGGLYGGAIANNNSYPMINNCTFVSNSVNASFGQGGAIYSYGAIGSQLSYCTFESNSADSGGAICAYSTLQVWNCSFSRNSAVQGGAIAFEGFGPTASPNCGIYNSLFDSNSASGATAVGGAVAAAYVNLDVESSTFTLNSCESDSVSNSASAGGIWFSGNYSDETFTAENSIFWQNAAINALGPVSSRESQQIAISQTTDAQQLFVNNSVIQDLNEFAGSSNLDVDPGFANPSGGDFSLRAYSPCIGQGDLSPAIFAYVKTDLAGGARLFSGRLDLGAYEYQGPPVPINFQLSLTQNCFGSGPIYSLQFSGTISNKPGTVYQWQMATNDEAGFVNINASSLFVISPAPLLQIHYPSTSMNGYRFRVTGSNNMEVFYSTSERLEVSESPLYVNVAAHGANTGSNWANAFTNLQSAQSVAGPCSQIWVARGTYYPSPYGNPNTTFALNTDVAIYGGFAGNETALNQRNWQTNLTILSGLINGSNGPNSQTIVANYGSQPQPGCGPTAILDGFVLCNAAGSAMINFYASPTIRNCTFTTNFGIEGGAILNGTGSSPTLSDCVFTNNSGQNGGALYSYPGANPTFVNCLFAGNQSSNYGAVGFLDSDYVTFINCTMAGNFSAYQGGGIFLQGATNALVNCVLWGNTDQDPYATATSAQVYLAGAGIYRGVAQMTNSCVQGLTNSANGNFGFDPLFDNAFARNYRLTSHSPAINAGSSALLTNFSTDLDGNNRFSTATVDLGAYEYQGIPATAVRIYSTPQPAFACSVAGNAAFTVTGTNGSASSFVWEVNRNDGRGFADDSSDAVVLGAASSSLIISNLTTSMNGWQYAVALPGNGYLSTPALLTVLQPTVIYVNSHAQGTGDGTTWVNAYTSLQAAIAGAGGCSEIWVAQGLFEPYNFNGRLYYWLVPHVEIYGGFAGTETNLAQRNWTNHPTILTGGYGNNALFENFVYATPVDASAVLDGFTLTSYGNAAIENEGTSPTIRNCIFTNNFGDSIDNYFGAATVSNCTFTGNAGLCIYSVSNNPPVINCVFSNNSGGCIYNQLTAQSISNCVFVGNRTGYEGAAIENNQANPVIVGCLFESNSASSGGAIENDSLSAPVIDRCIFSRNSASVGAAMEDGLNAAPVVKNSLFDQNSSTYEGGAVTGGGTGLSFINCAFVRNSSGYSGAGLFFQGTSASIVNCIFWMNTVTLNPYGSSLETIQLDNEGATPAALSVSNSIVQGLQVLSGNNNRAYDPLFTNFAGGNFQLTAYSPAINAGLLAPIVSEATDLAGNARVVGGRADLGPYEFQGTPSAPVAIQSLPYSQTNCTGTSVQFTLVTQVGGTNVFQWQILSGTNFVNLVGTAPYQISTTGVTNTLLVSPLSTALNGTQYRVVTGGYVSPSFTLGVNPPTIVCVNAAAAGNGDGSSWASALNNLQTALQQGGSCTEIWVAQGRYTPTPLRDGSDTFSLAAGMQVYGGFSGTETNLSQRNWTNYPTILQGLGNPVSGLTNISVIENDGTIATIDSSALLDGFTIDGQQRNVPAVINLAASPTFQNCTFINGGPAMENGDNANPVITSCVFSNNAYQAMVNYQSDPVITHSLFIDNACPAGGQGGGAMANTQSSPVISFCQFLTNSAPDGNGGAILLTGGSSAIVHASIFEGNTSAYGGALYSGGSTATLADCVLAGNVSTYEAGAIFLSSATLVVNNCTVAGNSASALGGGIYAQSASALETTNSIFWQNAAGQSASGSQAAQVQLASSTAQIVDCLVQGLSTFAAPGNIAYDPLFANPAGGDFTPGAASAAINAGANAAVSLSDTDVLGNPRIVGSSVDMGAIEVQNPGAGAALHLTTTPQPQSTCPNGSVSFVAIGDASVISNLTWQVNTGGGFGSIPNDGHNFVLTTSNSSTLIISNVPANYTNRTYGFTITNLAITSAPVALTVVPTRIIYVNAAANGNRSGVDWADGFTNFAAAVASGDACSEIWVARGAYQTAFGQPARMKAGLGIYGGFAGTETLLSQRNWTNNPTLLYGATNTAIIDNEGSIQPADQTAVLDGFSLTGAGLAGAIFNNDASPTIQNCTFFSNASIGIELVGPSSPWIANCAFVSNSDAAVVCGGGAPVLTNCLFANNQITTGRAVLTASAPGLPFLYDCSFQSNSAAESLGGAIDNEDTSVAIVNCIFNDNSAGAAGGALSTGGFTAITNTLFSDNSSPFASAIFNSGALELVNCTIVDNAATTESGAVTSESGTAILWNTILWGNTSGAASPEGQQLLSSGGMVVVTNCDIQGLTVYAGNNNLGADPLFLDPAAGSFQLSAFSPDINAGSNSFNLTPTDLAGAARVQLGIVDIGAYESATQSANTIALTLSPVSQSGCAGGSVSFAVQAQSMLGVTWQYRSNGVWTPFVSSGFFATGPALGSYNIFTAPGNLSDLSVAGLSMAMNGYQFRFVLTNGYTGAPLVLTVAPAGVLYVNAASGLGGNGFSWATAFNNLQSALSAVQGCQNQIWVAGGKYRPTSGTNSSISFAIPSGAEVYGGFAGFETNLSQRHWQSNVTILSGAIGGGLAAATNSVNVVEFYGSMSDPISPSTLLDGFTVTSGQTGILFNAAFPTVQNCTITSNSASGLVVSDSSPTITNCFIVNNSNGGGMFIYSENLPATPTVENCVFSGNSAVTGGAIHSENGGGTFTDCLMFSNNATDFGGAVFVNPGNISLINCTITANSVSTPIQPGGGGVALESATATIENTILWNDNSLSTNQETSEIDLVYQSVANVSDSCIAGLQTFAGNGNTGYDPLFVSVAASNYHLQPCSPLLGIGNATAVPGGLTDLDGNPRTLNGTIDIGVYELQTAPGTPLFLTSEPASFTYCPASPNLLSVTASGAASYQWQINQNTGAGFVDLTDNAIHSGSGTATLTITAPPVEAMPWQYRCLVQDGQCSVYSTAATMTVLPSALYVNASAPVGGNGLSWATAFQNIQQAATSPLADDCQAQVWVAAGTYTAASGSIVLKSGLQLFGGFVGTETNLNQRNPSNNLTVLMAGASSIVNANGNQISCDGSSIVDGFTISGSGQIPSIQLLAANPTIRNCSFISNNTASALLVQQSAPVLSNCFFLSNAVTPISAQNTFLTVYGCSFTGNSAGAIANQNSSQVAVINSIFTANSNAIGGAIWDDTNSMLSMTNCLFVDNTALEGGAVENWGTLTAVNCTFYGNAGSSSSASGLDNEYGSSTVENSIFWDNQQTALTLEKSQLDSSSVALSISNCLIQGLNQYTGNGNIGFSPLFLDPAHGNFQLNSGSPAINQGGLPFISGTTFDLAGRPRVINGQVDLGAYETGGSQSAVVNLTNEPVSTAICADDNATFAVVAANSAGFVWQYLNGTNWQAFSLSGGQWTGPALGTYAISSNSVSSTLTVSAVTASMNGYQFDFTIPAASYTGAPLVLSVTPSTRLYVNASAAPSGNGTSWATAYNNLSTALTAVNAATCASEIWIAAGTYSAPNNGFIMPAGAAIYGGFLAGQTNLSQRNWSANPTILTGSPAVNINGLTQTVGPSTILDGLVIQSSTPGLSIEGGSPTIRNCTFQNNSQGASLNLTYASFVNCSFIGNNSSTGGAVFSSQGAPAFLDCLFSNNIASTAGGAIDVQLGALDATNCIFTFNSAANGGAIEFAQTIASAIVNCTIVDNSASANGGGLQGVGSTVAVINTILWENSASGSQNESAQLNITSSTVSVSYSDVSGLSAFAGNSNLNVDPLLSSGEELTSCSPMVGAGLSAAIASVATDFASQPRLVNGRADIGALEYQGIGSLPLIITAQPQSIAFCGSGGNSFTFSATPTNNLVYQWEVNHNDGQGFGDLSDNATYTGSTNSILTINSASSADDGTIFQCVVTTSGGCSVTSQTASLSLTVTRIYVNAAAANGGTGQTWATAYQSLQQALGSTNFEGCNYEIWVAKGTYSVPSVGYGNLFNNLNLYGGFAGTETNLAQRNWQANPAILDGGGTVPIIFNNQQYDFFTGSGFVEMNVGPSARLDGFTLQNSISAAIADEPNQTPTIANCIFQHNTGSSISNVYTGGFITNCSFFQNGTSNIDSVGGIFSLGNVAPLTIEHCVFQGNLGNAILTDGESGPDTTGEGLVTIDNCLVTGNYGAAVVCLTPFIARNCTIAGNYYFGGALEGDDSYYSPCAVYNSIIWSNYGSYTSGYTESAQVFIITNVYNCIVEGIQSGDALDTNGNKAIDPQFVQGLNGASAPSLSGNFQLTPCSPAIDSGNSAQIGATIDLNGNPRISGAAVDIGAYEYQLPPFTVQPTNQVASIATGARFIAVNAATNAVYQWQDRPGTNANFGDIGDNSQFSGTAASTLVLTNLPYALKNYQFRCLVTLDGCLNDYSDVATLGMTNLAPIVYNISGTNVGAIYITPLGSDPQGLPLTYSVFTGPTNGGIIYNSDGNFLYENANGFFSGTDSFTYVANDGFVTSAPATITVDILPIPYPPTSTDQTLAVNENTSTAFVLNGTNLNGTTPLFSIATPPVNGVLTGTPPNLIYTPNSNFYGSDSFRFNISGSGYGPYPATVYITVAFVSQLPVTPLQTAMVYLGGTVSVPVLTQDYDPDGMPLTIIGVTQGSTGQVTFASNNISYSQNNVSATNDSFTYQVTDGYGSVSTGSVNVLIQTNLTYVVTTTNDSGAGSLRYAIDTAESLPGTSAFVVNFSSSLAGQTILLSTSGDQSFGSSAFALTGPMVIDASNAPGLVIAVDTNAEAMRLFNVEPSAQITLNNVFLSNGWAAGFVGGGGGQYGGGGGGGGGGFGGAIYSQGNLSVNNVVFARNQAVGGQGGEAETVQNVAVGGVGGGPNGGVASSGAGGFASGGGGSSDTTQSYGGAGGFGGGAGSGDSVGGIAGGIGGFGGGGGGGANSAFAGGGGAGMGGAIFNNAGILAVTNCSFVRNAVVGGMGGVSYDGSFEFGTPGLGLGGAVINYNGAATFSNCNFETNSADQADGLYNVGDGVSSSITLLDISATNNVPATNFMQASLNGGSASALRDNVSAFSEGDPSLPVIPNQTTLGPLTLNLSIRTNVTLSATSDNALLLPASSLTVSGSGNSSALTITPVLGPSGSVRVTATVSDTNGSLGEIFTVNITNALTASVSPSHTVAIPVLETNSTWQITLVVQGSNGFVTFTGSTLTYSNNGTRAGDVFFYQYTDGTNSAYGQVTIDLLTNVVSTAASQSVTTELNTPLPITLSGTDSLGDPVSYFVDSQPAHGTLSGVAPNMVYSPSANFSGADSFTFHVNNLLFNSPEGTISIAVRGASFATITNEADSGPGSLRNAITDANSGAMNTWYITVPESVSLSSVGDDGFGASALVISNRIVLEGENAGVLISRAANGAAMRLIRVANVGELTLLNLSLSNGLIQGPAGGSGIAGGGGGPGMGGAIYNEGVLNLTNVVLTQNQAIGGNGGLVDTNDLTNAISDSAGGNGGGPQGGIGQIAGAGSAGGFASGGAGASAPAGDISDGAVGGYGGGSGGTFPDPPFIFAAGSGGFGGGGGGGAVTGGGGGAGMGGGIFNHGGAVNLVACLFTNNVVAGGENYGSYNGILGTAQGMGASAFNDSGTVTVSNCVWTDFYNVGDGTQASLTLMDSGASTDLTAGSVNGGTSYILSYGMNDFTNMVPRLSAISDKIITNALQIPFTFAAASINPAFDAFSADSITLPDSDLSVSSNELTITAGLPGETAVTLQITDGSLTYAQVFNVTALQSSGALVWTNPAGITYGTALTGAELNATASIAGTFSYTPPLGTVLAAGSNQTLFVTFNPSNTAVYYPVTKTVSITVIPAPLTVSASAQVTTYGTSIALTGDPHFISAGLQNSDRIASVSMAVSGTEAGSREETPGTYTLTPHTAIGGIFTAANYNITYQTNSLTVMPAPLSVTATTQLTAYGTAITLGGSTDFTSSGLQNNETIGSVNLSVSGAFAGASNEPAGSYTLTPSAAAGGTFSPTNYSITYNPGTLIVDAAIVQAQSTVFTNLHSFGLTNTDGAIPAAGLILSGNTLYGTTLFGGSSGDGAVFAINTDGTGLSILYNFTNGTDGGYPTAGLIMADGTLYGTASGFFGSGGTIFAVKTNGAGFATLYSFTNGIDGSDPSAGLILSGHTLYGIADDGGSLGDGSVFAINTNGNDFTNVYVFTNGVDGDSPSSGLILSGTTLYGCAYSGGTSGNGSVYAVNTDGTGFTNVYSFTGGIDGSGPEAGLILSGNTLYGTASGGGIANNGAVFSVNCNGTDFRDLYLFTGGLDSGDPEGGLILLNTNLFGTASGGNFDSGGLFSLSTNGASFSVLYDFTAATQYTNSDGANPSAGLVLSGNTLYGTGEDGGPASGGTVFSLALGPVSTQQGSLQVTIAPSNAVTAGAQWQVQPGVYQGSGSIAANLPVGPQIISFVPVPGFNTPADQTVTIANGVITTATGIYTVPSGSLTVTILPVGAVNAGAQWQVDAGATQSSGATVSNLSVGSHVVSFTAVPGFSAPAQQTVSVSDGGDVVTTGAYVSITGALTVILEPAGAVSDGASWQVDNGSIQTNGAIVSNLLAGTHIISFATISNWNAPASESVTITAGVITTNTAVYTIAALPPTGSLTVTLQPAGAVSAGAKWQVDGGATENSGATVTNLLSGSHIVSFATIPGWDTPSNQTVTISSNVTTTALVVYMPVNTPTNNVVLLTNGYGTISHPAITVIGKTYKVTALPKNKNIFVNWIGGTNQPYSVLSASPAYTFTNEPNLLLEANFETNIFLAAEGIYRGLFAPADAPREETNSGSFLFTVTSAGAVTGNLNVGGQKVDCAGKFDLTGEADMTTKATRTEPAMTVSLQLDFSNQSVGGFMSITNGGFTAALDGFRDAFSVASKATNYAGRYTLVIPGTNDPMVGPLGDSYGAVTISSTGSVTVAGSLADGTPFSQSSVVSQAGYWPLYINLYGGKGSLWGWNYFSNQTVTAFPTLSWINPTNSAKTALYRSGFTNHDVTVIGALYVPTELRPTNLTVTLQGGDLLVPITNGVTLSSSGRITVTNIVDETNKLQLTITKSTGLVSGSFANPRAPKETIKINGVLLQGRTNVQGYFQGTNESGTLQIVSP